MSVEILRNNIKKGIPNAVYLFFGPEVYLVNHYLKELEALIVSPSFRSFNYNILEGKDSEKNIIDYCETVPIMSDKKLIVVKNSGMFGGEPKTKKDKPANDIQSSIAEYLGKLPHGVYIVFIESEVNKKSKLFSTVKNKGMCVEFEHQKAEELTKWAVKIFNSYGIKVGKAEALYLINLCNPGMTDILNEIKKLIEYAGEGNIVQKAHIDDICVKSLQGKVFEMIDAITQKNPSKAYRMLNDMLILKEPLQKINVLVERHFRLMFFVGQMKFKGYSAEKIASHMNMQTYIASKYIKQCEKFKLVDLEEAVKSCLDMDVKVKTGRIEPRVALETIIAKYSV